MISRRLVKVTTWGLLIGLLIGALARCGLPQERLWDLFDELQRQLWPAGPANELIIRDPARLERRIKRDVDRAIQDVLPEYDRIIEQERRLYRPRYSEQPVPSDICWSAGCRALDPAMRLCAPWVEGCDGQPTELSQ